ncbi:MAG: hypothetical protein ACXWDL_06830 [Nocardioides sp.]
MNTEYDKGTYVRIAHHTHLGYYAGDFSGHPSLTRKQVQQLIDLRLPAGVRPRW